MFKKIMKLFSSIVLLFVFVCIFTSCESEESKTSHTTHTYSYKSNAEKHWRECSCGDKKDEEDHTFGGWITTKEATITSTGTKERECSVCHYKETDTIAVLDHNTHSYTEIKSNETKHWKECSCGDKKDEESHTFGSWVTTKEPTETTDGVKERECSICHYKETDTIAKHTHSYTEIKSNETKHWKECSCGAKSEEENHTFGNWQTIKEASYTEKGLKKRVCSKCSYEETEDIAIKEITDVSTFIQDNNDIITANLETHYENAVKKDHGRYYDTERFTMTSYRWDLGEVVDGKIQNLKVILKYHNNLASVDIISIYNVTLNEAIEITSLLDATTMTNTKATYSSAYSYTYDATKQHDRDDLIKAILDVAVTDGFEYQLKEVIYNENSGSTDPNLGSIKSFSVIISNENEIKSINIVISSASTDNQLITNINNGKYLFTIVDEAEFSSNQLKEVDLTAPTDPNSIEYLIYYHNDEITANLETQYQSVLRSAFGRVYTNWTDRYDVLYYRWDLGEVVEGKIQNLKMTLNYYDKNSSNNILRVYDVTLSESIDLKTLLNASAMSNVKTTNVISYTYVYDATKQHDMDEVWKKLAELELKGLEYDEVLYRRDSGSSEFGSSTLYTIAYISNGKIEQVRLVIKDSSTIDGKISNLINGNYRVPADERVETNFTSNQLKEVDLTVSTNN